MDNKMIGDRGSFMNRRGFLKGALGLMTFSVFKDLLIQEIKAQKLDITSDPKRDREIIEALTNAQRYSALIQSEYGITVQFLFNKIEIQTTADEKITINGADLLLQLNSVQLIYEELQIFPTKMLKTNISQYIEKIVLGDDLTHTNKPHGTKKVAGLALHDKRIFLDVVKGMERRTIVHEVGHQLDVGLDEKKWIEGINSYLEKYYKGRGIVFNPKYRPEEFEPTSSARLSGFAKTYGIKSWREDFATMFELFACPNEIIDVKDGSVDAAILEAKMNVLKNHILKKFDLDESYIATLQKFGGERGNILTWKNYWLDVAQKKSGK